MYINCYEALVYYANRYLESDSNNLESFFSTLNEYGTDKELNYSKLSENKAKYEDILNYVVKNSKNLKSANVDKLINEIVTKLMENNVKLNLDKETADEIVDKHLFLDYKMPKSHPKTSKFVKRFLTPVLIGSAIGVGASFIVNAMFPVLGISAYNTGYFAADLMAYVATIAPLTAAATVLTTYATHWITKFHYSKKYGKLSNENLSHILNSYVKNAPYMELMNKIEKTEEKIANSKNKIKNFFLKKIQRNRMHALLSFKKYLKEVYDISEQTIFQDQRAKLVSTIEQINQFKGKIFNNNLIVALHKRVLKDKVQEFLNSDIIIADELNSSNKYSKSKKIKNNVKKLRTEVDTHSKQTVEKYLTNNLENIDSNKKDEQFDEEKVLALNNPSLFTKVGGKEELYKEDDNNFNDFTDSRILDPNAYYIDEELDAIEKEMSDEYKYVGSIDNQQNKDDQRKAIIKKIKDNLTINSEFDKILGQMQIRDNLDNISDDEIEIMRSEFNSKYNKNFGKRKFQNTISSMITTYDDQHLNSKAAKFRKNIEKYIHGFEQQKLMNQDNNPSDDKNVDL